MHQIRAKIALAGVMTSLLFLTFVVIATTLPTLA